MCNYFESGPAIQEMSIYFLVLALVAILFFLAILVEDLMRTIWLKLFLIWLSNSGDVIKDFSAFRSGDHFVWRSETICTVLVEGL